jgi:hypothetical protein
VCSLLIFSNVYSQIIKIPQASLQIFENAPVEEDASREGHLPGINLGDQTDFLVPDVTVTKLDHSLDTGKAWEPMDSCAVDPSDDKGTPAGS